jgi:hypothetical protein
MGTMIMIIHGIPVIVNEIIAMNIINITIVIIINSVTGNFAGVCPNVCCKVGAGNLPGVNDTNNHTAPVVVSHAWAAWILAIPHKSP